SKTSLHRLVDRVSPFLKASFKSRIIRLFPSSKETEPARTSGGRASGCSTRPCKKPTAGGGRSRGRRCMRVRRVRTSLIAGCRMTRGAEGFGFPEQGVSQGVQESPLWNRGRGVELAARRRRKRWRQGRGGNRFQAHQPRRIGEINSLSDSTCHHAQAQERDAG